MINPKIATALAIAAMAQAPEFESYKVASGFHGIPAKIDFSSNPSSMRFRTRLEEGAANGPNFAGELTVVFWGCGTNCAMATVLSARTGKILRVLTTCGGVEYRLDSSLLAIDADEGKEQLPRCEPRYYRWENNRLEEIHRRKRNE